MLFVLGSNTLLVTHAMLESVPDQEGSTLTLMETVTLPALAMSPKLQMIEPVPLQLPWLGVAETKVTFAGKLSPTVTPVASEGPSLITVRL